MVRGIRGAITVEEDTPEAIHQATRELLLKMLEANGIQSYEELAAVIFTVTEDLTSAFPAEAARQIGMHRVPLLSAREVPVNPEVIRYLNRLSDLLFVLARVVNAREGIKEEGWLVKKRR